VVRVQFVTIVYERKKTFEMKKSISYDPHIFFYKD